MCGSIAATSSRVNGGESGSPRASHRRARSSSLSGPMASVGSRPSRWISRSIAPCSTSSSRSSPCSCPVPGSTAPSGPSSQPAPTSRWTVRPTTTSSIASRTASGASESNTRSAPRGHRPRALSRPASVHDRRGGPVLRAGGRHRRPGGAVPLTRAHGRARPERLGQVVPGTRRPDPASADDLHRVAAPLAADRRRSGPGAGAQLPRRARRPRPVTARPPARRRRPDAARHGGVLERGAGRPERSRRADRPARGRRPARAALHQRPGRGRSQGLRGQPLCAGRPLPRPRPRWSSRCVRTTWTSSRSCRRSPERSAPATTSWRRSTGMVCAT